MPVRMMESSAVAMVMTSRGLLPEPNTVKLRTTDDYPMTSMSDNRFENNLSPSLVGVPDVSRSPSVGETFVSAATDGPHSSSEESDSSDDDMEPNHLRRANPLGSLSSNSNPNSATTFDPLPSLPLENNLIQGPLSPGEGPSGSTSISMSIGSMGDASADGSSSEPSIVVKLFAEKKGLFLKYSEYEVKSKSYDTIVRRKFKDFEVLYSYLMERYPYRMIPPLPPKQLLLYSHLEERRQGLQIWLTVISTHPVLGSSPIFVTFLSDKTADYQYRMQVMYEKQPDEFSRLREGVDLPWEDQQKLLESRNRLRNILYSLHKLRKIFDEQAVRVEQQARDMAEVDVILQGLEVRDVFGERTFDDVSQSAQEAARQSERYVQLQRNVVNERIHVLMDLLAAHNDLCQRVDKGIYSDHQKALSKTLGISRTQLQNAMRGASSGNGSVVTASQSVPPANNNEPPATSDAILNRKCAFALQCVRSETALAEKYLQSLPEILLSYANEESQYHSKVTDIEYIRANRWKYFINFSFAADVEDLASASS